MPVPAEGLPLDGAMLLTGLTWGESGQPSEVAFPGPREITVRDGAGAVVPGQTTTWLFYVAWRPTAPLPPATEFTLEAVSRSLVPRPTGIAGQPTFQTQFRTGERAAPPLQLSGALEIALETHDLDVHSGCNTCGTGCTSTRQVRALRARVKLPIASGGQASVAGYDADLWLTNDQPRQLPDGPEGSLVSLGVWRVILPDQPAEAVIAIPEEDRPYAPCFSLQVTDPAGRAITAAPVCLPSMDVARKIHELDGTSDGAGCNVTRATPGLSAVTLAALALLLAAMLRHRWRIP